MKTKKQINELLKKTKSDDRLGYPPANVFINAPLALIQVELKTRADTLAWVLERNKE